MTTMDIKEIAQILKNIPNDLYKVPQYGTLFNDIKIHKYSVALNITLSTGTIVFRVCIYDDMDFTLRIYNENIVINHLRVTIKEVANRIESYLNILGFNCINVLTYINNK